MKNNRKRKKPQNLRKSRHWATWAAPLRRSENRYYGSNGVATHCDEPGSRWSEPRLCPILQRYSAAWWIWVRSRDGHRTIGMRIECRSRLQKKNEREQEMHTLKSLAELLAVFGRGRHGHRYSQGRHCWWNWKVEHLSWSSCESPLLVWVVLVLWILRGEVVGWVLTFEGMGPRFRGFIRWHGPDSDLLLLVKIFTK